MLFLLFPCCLCCLLWGYWIPCCWLWEDGARRPPSYFSSPSRKGSLCPILQQQARRTLAKNGVNIGRSQAKSGAKPCNKSGESLEKVVSHRPLWTWRTVVARVHIDRHEHEQRSVWDDFLKAFAEKTRYFQLTKAMFLAHQILTYRSPPQQIPPLPQNAAMYNNLTLLSKSKKRGREEQVHHGSKK